jgi:hypothetical protein
MHGRVPRGPGLPFGGGLNFLLLAGGAYFVWEHGQGRHERPHVLCPLCWLNKVDPTPEASGGTSPAEPPEQALPAPTRCYRYPRATAVVR